MEKSFLNYWLLNLQVLYCYPESVLTLVHTAYPFAFSFNLYGTAVFQSLLLLFYIASYCSWDTAAA
jgi:hypothetical protein